MSALLFWIVFGVDGCKYFDNEQRSKHYQLLASLSITYTQHRRVVDTLYIMSSCSEPPVRASVMLSTASAVPLLLVYLCNLYVVLSWTVAV